MAPEVTMLARDHAMIFATLVACSCLVGCGAADDEPLGEGAQQMTADYFLKLDGVEGESKSGTMIEWLPAADGTATGVLALECDGSACLTTDVTATLQSGYQAFEPANASVWLVDGSFGSDLVVTKASAQNPAVLSIQTIDGDDRWSTSAIASAVTCAPSDCSNVVLLAGWICLPTCTLTGSKLP
jgi:hypothetical protein